MKRTWILTVCVVGLLTGVGAARAQVYSFGSGTGQAGATRLPAYQGSTTSLWAGGSVTLNPAVFGLVNGREHRAEDIQVMMALPVFVTTSAYNMVVGVDMRVRTLNAAGRGTRPARCMERAPNAHAIKREAGCPVWCRGIPLVKNGRTGQYWPAALVWFAQPEETEKAAALLFCDDKSCFFPPEDHCFTG